MWTSFVSILFFLFFRFFSFFPAPPFYLCASISVVSILDVIRFCMCMPNLVHLNAHFYSLTTRTNVMLSKAVVDRSSDESSIRFFEAVEDFFLSFLLSSFFFPLSLFSFLFLEKRNNVSSEVLILFILLHLLHDALRISFDSSSSFSLETIFDPTNNQAR